MKNTNTKTIVLEVVSLIVVVGIIAAAVALFSNGMKKATDAIDDAFGDLQTGEADTPADTNTDTGSDSIDSDSSDSTDTDSSDSSDTSTDTEAPVDDGKLTLANGDIYFAGCRSDGATSSVALLADGLKANTEYKISWSFDSTYESYGFSLFSKDCDDDGTVEFVVCFSATSNVTDNDYLVAYSESKSSLLTSSFTFTTTDEAYFEFAPFFVEGTYTDSDSIKELGDTLLSLINYIEIEEVTA